MLKLKPDLKKKKKVRGSSRRVRTAKQGCACKHYSLPYLVTTHYWSGMAQRSLQVPKKNVYQQFIKFNEHSHGPMTPTPYSVREF